MIENLRYYINGKKLLIRWNWIGVDDTARAQCRLVKRLSHDIIEEYKDITISMYETNRCGCTFDMPNVPAAVEVSDDGWMTWSERLITEAPRYRVSFSEGKKKIDRVTSFFGIEKEPEKFERTMELCFSEQLTDIEIKQYVHGWMFEGVSRLNDHRFYFPKPGKRKVTLWQQVSEEEYRAGCSYGITPEIEKTIYHDMFQKVDDVSASAQTEHEAMNVRMTPIRLDCIQKRGENGFYRIKCPYCFGEYGYYEPEFRSKVYTNESNGFGARVDQKYIDFYQTRDRDRAELEQNNKMGYVLNWEEDISEVQYSQNPGTWVKYSPEDRPLKDIVIAVRDRMGNPTEEKVCPLCHHRISTLSGLFPSVFISMMGNTGCGKTVYLASMLHELEMGSMLPGYRFNYNMCENDRGKEVRRIYDEKIAGHASAAEENKSALGDSFATTSDFSATQENGIHELAPTISSDFTPADLAMGTDFAPVDFSGGMDFAPAAPLMQPISTEPSFSQGDPESFNATPAELDDEPVFDMNGMTDLSGMKASSTEKTLELDLSGGRLQQIADFEQKPKILGNVLPTGTERKYIDPCIYELSGVDPETKQRTGVIIAFFDFPGEAIRVGNEISDNDRHLREVIENVDGYVFLFDPSSLKRVSALPERTKKEFLERTLRGADENKWRSELKRTPGEILADFRKTFIGEAATAQVDKPVSFVISKSDAIRDYLKLADHQMKQVDTYFLDAGVYALDSTRTGLYLDEIKKESSSILDFMDDPQMREACRLLMKQEEDGIWFCTSATGIAPDKNGTLYRRHGVPVHVIEPVEFILYRLSEKRNVE